MDTWQDPNLGRFCLHPTGWATTISLPAFKMFKFQWFGRQVGRTKTELSFETDDTHQTPSEQAIAVAVRLIEQHKALANRIIKAVWDDLNGRGPDSGMWWHGDPQLVQESITHHFKKGRVKPFNQSQDVCNLIGNPSIRIREEIYAYTRPSAEIRFSAVFDEEHGLGVLTDGRRVVGTGYQCSVQPFFEEQITSEE